MAKKIFFFISALGLFISFGVGYIWPHAHILLFIVVPYILIGLYDLYISSHNILRNYPVIGHMRYILESIRPEMQQYFVATNQSEQPFNRETRSLVYQRAKLVNDTLPFGTQLDLYQPGYEYAHHSLSPKIVDPESERIWVGGDACKKPYHASRLNISAMSYGALGHNAIEALNWGAKMGNFAHNTGEGGLSPYHLKRGGDIILQLGTAYFGFRNPDGTFNPELFEQKANLDVVKMIEIKISQGAKPSHGGLLPAAKISPEIAEIRGIPEDEDCFSPPTHNTFSNPRELMTFITHLRELSGGKPIGFKLCIGIKREFFSICKAMLETNVLPDFITVDGAEGGTGAAPVEFSNRLGMPINEALPFVHNTLLGCGLRDKIRIISSGKIATGFDMMHKIAIGADMCNSARAMMFTVGCIQARKCNTNECPTGVATQDASRNEALVPNEKRFHTYNYHKETVKSFLELTGAIGIDHPDKLRPEFIYYRRDDMRAMNYSELFPQLAYRQLLEGKEIPSYFRDWNHATADSF
ncbi:FMN-binding glutamate synthase family protein [Legionella sp. W05-934-2]|jgi:glutamate synthase domain-containing protein 2|uniref:FMN-binding glutamate synthase family protein n=1 Tax=Legionella sp. W05-934-2 TaxID=1198649 RepID=UPI0034623FF2